MKRYLLPALLLAAAVQTQAQLPQRPNVVIIVADDMNMYSVKKNYPQLKTPNLDRLMSQSLVFSNATCAAPLCVPSRASFFSGIYPHKTGAYSNVHNTWTSAVLSQSEVMPETFHRSGYTTWGRGKIFHAEINGTREADMFDNKVQKGGFGPFGDKKNWYGKAKWSVIQPWTGPDTDFPDVRNANEAVNFLGESHDKPFFLYYGLFRPHSPYTAPKRFFDQYDGVKFTRPPGYMENDLSDVPQLGKEMVDSLKGFRHGMMSHEQIWMEYMRAYCANFSFADWNIGRVLEAIDKSPNAANTIVIFISDNGFHNGVKEHQAKHTLWDDADVIPFIVRMPNGKAYRCPQSVSLLDIYPTLVELCGLQKPTHPLDGSSMVSVFKNPAAKWTRPSFTSYDAGYGAVRDERYRYILYPDGSEELYDHVTDPYEHTNQASNKKLADVKKRLKQYVPKEYAPSIGSKKGKDNED